MNQVLGARLSFPRSTREQIKMQFICKDCANSIHTNCDKQHCECQHRVDKKNLE